MWTEHKPYIHSRLVQWLMGSSDSSALEIFAVLKVPQAYTFSDEKVDSESLRAVSVVLISQKSYVQAIRAPTAFLHHGQSRRQDESK